MNFVEKEAVAIELDRRLRYIWMNEMLSQSKYYIVKTLIPQEAAYATFPTSAISKSAPDLGQEQYQIKFRVLLLNKKCSGLNEDEVSSSNRLKRRRTGVREVPCPAEYDRTTAVLLKPQLRRPEYEGSWMHPYIGRVV
jgi:hypothetical protein